MALSKRLRFEVMRRDNHTCRYCGRSAPEVKLTVDHVLPVALGGQDEPTNLVTACVDCNSGKSSMTADHEKVDAVSAEALRWADAIKKASQMRAAEAHQYDAEVAAFDQHWLGFHTKQPKTIYEEIPLEREREWEKSVRKFLALGVSPERLNEFIDVAMAAKIQSYKVWRYFCGCAWNEVKRIQEIAASLVEERPIPPEGDDDPPKLEDLP